jgi:hypothetical protein
MGVDQSKVFKQCRADAAEFDHEEVDVSDARDPQALTTGSVACIQGFEGEEQLNGRLVTCKEWDAANCSWTVCLEGGREVSVKVEKLVKVRRSSRRSSRSSHSSYPLLQPPQRRSSSAASEAMDGKDPLASTNASRVLSAQRDWQHKIKVHAPVAGAVAGGIGGGCTGGPGGAVTGAGFGFLGGLAQGKNFGEWVASLYGETQGLHPTDCKVCRRQFQTTKSSSHADYGVCPTCLRVDGE